MDKLAATAILTFFVSLGVILGGSILGGLGAGLVGKAPMHTMLELAEEMKLWALVTALGGAFGIIKAFETGILGGQPLQLVQQMALVFCAFAGAHLGFIILYFMSGGQQ